MRHLRQLRLLQARGRASLTRQKPAHYTVFHANALLTWLNMVEIFVGIITRQAIRRGSCTDVTDPHDAIRIYIDGYNARAQPFAWTKNADELLDRIKRKQINRATLDVRFCEQEDVSARHPDTSGP